MTHSPDAGVLLCGAQRGWQHPCALQLQRPHRVPACWDWPQPGTPSLLFRPCIPPAAFSCSLSAQIQPRLKLSRTQTGWSRSVSHFMTARVGAVPPRLRVSQPSAPLPAGSSL